MTEPMLLIRYGSTFGFFTLTAELWHHPKAIADVLAVARWLEQMSKTTLLAVCIKHRGETVSMDDAYAELHTIIDKGLGFDIAFQTFQARITTAMVGVDSQRG